MELTNITEALMGLDDDEKLAFRIPEFQTPGRGGDSGKRILINEPGIYALVIRSRKPEAKTFKRWIMHTVIPEIRRTGGFLKASKEMFFDCREKKNGAPRIPSPDNGRELLPKQPAA